MDGEIIGTIPYMPPELLRDGMAVVEYEGKSVGFCCPMCVERWDPMSDEERAKWDPVDLGDLVVDLAEPQQLGFSVAPREDGRRFLDWAAQLAGEPPRSLDPLGTGASLADSA